MDDLGARIEIGVVVAVAAVVIAAIQAWVAFMTYHEGRPNLILRMEHVVLQSGLDLGTLSGALLEVMQKHPVTSHYFVGHILANLGALNKEDKQYERDLAELIEEIQRAEVFFTGRPRAWDRDETTYENGVVTWPDRYRLNLTGPLARVPGVFEPDVLEAVRASVGGGRELADSMRSRLIEQAVKWDDPSSDDKDERSAVKNTLAYVRRLLEQAAGGLRDEVVLSVVVENRSERPNSISRGFLIVGAEVKIEMRRRRNEARVDRYGSRSLDYYRGVASLDEDDRTKVRQAVEQGSGIVFRAVDINGRTWGCGP